MRGAGRGLPRGGSDERNELTALFARAYVRYLVAEAEKARNDAVSFDKNGSICLEIPRQKWPPPVAPEARRT